MVVLACFLAVFFLFWRFGVQVLTAGGGELKTEQTGALLLPFSRQIFFSLGILIFLEKVLDRYIANVLLYQ